jgi:putative oxidoreductase
MKRLEKIKFWGDHHPQSITFLRIALGLTLIWKGVFFITNPDVLANFLKETGITDQIGLSVFITATAQLIIILHLIGGVCIAFGIQTRLFCLLNLPALIGAVLFVNLNGNLLRQYSELWLSLIVLLALVCFSIKGSDSFATNGETNNRF